jgi:hypothetical protein
VLDDLGLPAALDFLAEETTTGTMPVTAEVVDDTGFSMDRRPPTEVELAMFRIASEAVAMRFATPAARGQDSRAPWPPIASRLRSLTTAPGCQARPSRDAAKRKRLGLASMRPPGGGHRRRDLDRRLGEGD